MHFSQWLTVNIHEIIGYLLALILIPRILLERRHPGATVAWLLAIGLVPYLGVPLYFLIGGRRVRRVSREKHLPYRDGSVHLPLMKKAEISQDSVRIARLLNQSGAFPPAMKNSVTVIDDGVEAYLALVKMFEEATSTIEVATFILGRDGVGRRIVEVLAEKAASGVEVRLLLDALGSMRTRGRFINPLREAGGKVGVFMPLLPLRRKWSANLRNHRKIAIVDRRVAFTGGMNLTEKYMGPEADQKRWKDVSIRIEGPAVADILTVFREDWIYATGEEFKMEPNPPEPKGGCVLQVAGDGPDIPERPIYSGILAALGQAKKRILVVTPYFVPDEPLSAALALAARMGRQVRIILPEHSNHPLVDLAGRSFFPELVEAGVDFSLFGPGMLHAKLITIDDKLAVVGTANMDMRSFNLNFEIATFLYSRHDVEKVERVVGSIEARSRRLTPAEVLNEGRIKRFGEDVCRVFSPLL